MIGRLDQRVTLQAYATTDDGAGGKIKAWANLSSVPVVWAKVAPKSGNENLEEGRVNASAGYVFTIRNRTDLDERIRIIWRNEEYNVRSIMRTGERSMYLRIEADRGVAQ